MKLTKKQLVKLIKETIYVDKKGTAATTAQARDTVIRKDKIISKIVYLLKKVT